MKFHTHFVSFVLLNLASDYTNVAAEPAILFHVTTATPTTTSLPYSLIQSGTTIVRPIGTGADGKTTYVQENVLSLIVAKFPPTNDAQPSESTLLSAPLTLQATFAEDKNGYHATRSLSFLSPEGTGSYQAGVDEECVFNSDGTGSCVRVEITLDQQARMQRTTTTYSGQLHPWHTVVEFKGTTPGVTGNSARGGVVAKDGWALGILALMMSVSVSLLSGLGLLGFGIW